jgi:hypothetical protein
MSRFLRIGETIINPKWISYMTITPEVCKIKLAPMDIDGIWLFGSGSMWSNYENVLKITQKENPQEYDKIKKWIEENSE